MAKYKVAVFHLSDCPEVEVEADSMAQALALAEPGLKERVCNTIHFAVSLADQDGEPDADQDGD